MSKALVIKNVDFEENRVAVITFSNIPCTGITFDESTYTINGYESVEVDYELTPSDTTDTVVWSSSNQDIVTISDGVMTIVGVGACTITATCGEFSATASVTVQIFASLKFYWATQSFSDQTHIASYTPSTSYTQLMAFGAGSSHATNVLLSTTSTILDAAYGIKIPKNTAKIRVSSDSGTISTADNSNAVWLHDVQNNNGGIYGVARTTEKMNANPYDFVIPTDAGTIDAVAVHMRLASAQSDYSDNPDGYATAKHITIEFIPPTVS